MGGQESNIRAHRHSLRRLLRFTVVARMYGILKTCMRTGGVPSLPLLFWELNLTSFAYNRFQFTVNKYQCSNG